MKIRPHGIGVCLVGSLLLVLAMSSLGCARLGRLWHRRQPDLRAPPALSERDAIILARLEATSKGILIEPYDITTRQKKESWWVRFRMDPPKGIKKRRKVAKAWPYRFVVEVSSRGYVRLLKDY